MAPLASARAGAGFDDLAPVGALVGDARAVGLGEATHGTREFFQRKHRSLECLVETKGFRAVARAPTPAARRAPSFGGRELTFGPSGSRASTPRRAR